MAPYFSIVIPVYNRSETLRPTLQSCLDQTFGDFEALVVDDGSRDGEALKAVVESYGDPRLRYVWRENGGGGAARNTGIDQASGRYVAFLDSDDLFAPTKLAMFRDLFEAEPDIFAHSTYYVDRGKEKLWIWPKRPKEPGESFAEYCFVYNNFIQTSSIILPAAVAKAVRFDPMLPKGQDLDFCLRVDAEGLEFRLIEEPLSTFIDRTVANRVSHTKGAQALGVWLDKSGPYLTSREAKAFKATILSYFAVQDHPVRVVGYLMDALVSARVPPNIVARQFLRCFLPTQLYRRLTGLVVGVAGARA